mmetsp:Transcript_5268/g.15735  ORF Transcript_5268/g.15735 Transcript_5268/m.15735 type:complete len:108 (-) Transcript_5268:1313-1636(-)
MADQSDDVFARAYGAYEDARDSLLESDAYKKGRGAAQRASKAASSTAKFIGNSAWVIGTALVIGLFPALFAIDRELNPMPPGGPEFPLMEPPPAVVDGTSSNPNPNA